MHLYQRIINELQRTAIQYSLPHCVEDSIPSFTKMHVYLQVAVTMSAPLEPLMPLKDFDSENRLWEIMLFLCLIGMSCVADEKTLHNFRELRELCLLRIQARVA